MKTRILAPPFLLVLTLGLALALACQSQHGAQPGSEATRRATTAASADPPASQPTLQALKNATYQGLEGLSGPVTLTDGSWEGEPSVPGGASRPSANILRDFHLLGDLDGDSQQEAVVLLGARGGGTGDYVHVAVVARRGSSLQNVATALLGDRVQVRSGHIESGRIVLDVVQPGANDAMCCPGDLVTRTWSLTPKGIEEAPPAPGGRLALETLAGKEWVLRYWAWDEPAAREPEVTLVVQGDRIVGRSGCNRYTAEAKPGEAPGDVTLGPAAGTRMACPEPAATVESRFLSQLQGVKKFGFLAGQLVLSYEKDGVFGAMLLEARPMKTE